MLERVILINPCRIRKSDCNQESKKGNDFFIYLFKIIFEFPCLGNSKLVFLWRKKIIHPVLNYFNKNKNLRNLK